MPQIAIEISDKNALKEIEEIAATTDGFISQRKGMDGITVCTVVMTLSPLIVGGIVKIYQAQQQARKYVLIKIDGVEIRGVSESALLKIFEAAQARE